jgi:transposase
LAQFEAWLSGFMEKCHGDFNRPVPERLVFERPLLVALELSKATWVVALSAPLSDRIRHHSITGGDAAALLKLIGQARSRAEAALGQPVRVVCCYEAGYDGFWLHRVLTAHGIDNHVLDAASLLVNRRAPRVKTDRIDVDGLLRALAALVRGERHTGRAVHVPSVEDEDCRRQNRERERLITERTVHVNCIKGLLMAQGIRDFMPMWPNAAERLTELRTGDGRPLPPCLATEIWRERPCAAGTRQLGFAPPIRLVGWAPGTF